MWFFFCSPANKSTYCCLLVSMSMAALCIASISSTLVGLDPSFSCALLTNCSTSSASFSIEFCRVSTRASESFLNTSSMPPLNGTMLMVTQSIFLLSGSFLSSIRFYLSIAKLVSQSSTLLKCSSM